jgi:hypothetical protein
LPSPAINHEQKKEDADMANYTNPRFQSAADLRRLYPEFVAQIERDAIIEERARLKRAYTPSDHEDGERLLIAAAERANRGRQTRAH